MNHLDWIVAVALLEVTLALLVLIGLVRRVKRMEETLAAPPAPPKEDEAVAQALAGLTAQVAETSGLSDRLRGIEERLLAMQESLPDNTGIEAALSSLVEKVAVLERLEVIEKTLDEALLREPPEVHLEEQLKPMLDEAVSELDARLKSFTASLEKDRAETRSELVTRVLGDRGFSDVSIVRTTDAEDGASRLLVEARRDGMSFKGPVLVREGRVVEQKLRPSYPMFP